MSTDSPLISIIMPCFNAEKYLALSITSVLNQSYTNWELIIINDGSTDNSLSLLQSYSYDKIHILNQPNLGVCKARNNGLNFANGEFIAFLDADDTWSPDCLKKLYTTLAMHSEAALAYCGWKNIGLPLNQSKPYVPPNYEVPNKLALLFESCCWPIHACLTKKNIIYEAGLFDDRLTTSEDFLLWLKIGAKYSIVRVPEVLAYYHFHSNHQATDNKVKTSLNHWKAQKIFIKTFPEYEKALGNNIKKLMHGELLRRGYECYWKRDLISARKIFKNVMAHGYGSIKDWKYMLPSLLPLRLHSLLIKQKDSHNE